jgi:hypothetical protein
MLNTTSGNCMPTRTSSRRRRRRSDGCPGRSRRCSWRGWPGLAGPATGVPRRGKRPSRRGKRPFRPFVIVIIESPSSSTRHIIIIIIMESTPSRSPVECIGVIERYGRVGPSDRVPVSVHSAVECPAPPRGARDGRATRDARCANTPSGSWRQKNTLTQHMRVKHTGRRAGRRAYSKARLGCVRPHCHPNGRRIRVFTPWPQLQWRLMGHRLVQIHPPSLLQR